MGPQGFFLCVQSHWFHHSRPRNRASSTVSAGANVVVEPSRAFQRGRAGATALILLAFLYSARVCSVQSEAFPSSAILATHDGAVGSGMYPGGSNSGRVLIIFASLPPPSSVLPPQGPEVPSASAPKGVE